jgi:uncharacterized protein
MITKELLNLAAKNKGLVNKEYIEKDYFQDLFLSEICKKTNKLIFKGGTALYKLYSLERFSEDLDFSIISPFDVKSLIEEIVRGIDGASIKQIKETKNSISIKIGFKGILTIYNTLRLDISITNSILEEFDVKTLVSSYPDINPFSIRIMNINEILAEKIHSLLARQKARDLYDIFFLLKIANIDKVLTNNKLKNFGMKYNSNTLKKRIRNLRNLWIPELKSFVLADLPDFKAVSSFVMKKV